LDLTKPPPALNESLNSRDRLIETVYSIAEVQSRLANFHRERMKPERFLAKNDFAIRQIAQTGR